MQCASSGAPRRVWPPRLAPSPARAGPLFGRWSCGDIPRQSLSPRALALSHTLCGSPGTVPAPQGTRQGQGCPWGDRDLAAGPRTPAAATALQTAGTSPQARPCHRGPHDGPSAEPCRPGLPVCRRAGDTPVALGLTSPCTPGRAAGSREPAPGAEAGSIQSGNIIKLKLIKHLEKGLH